MRLLVSVFGQIERWNHLVSVVDQETLLGIHLPAAWIALSLDGVVGAQVPLAVTLAAPEWIVSTRISGLDATGSVGTAISRITASLVVPRVVVVGRKTPGGARRFDVIIVMVVLSWHHCWTMVRILSRSRSCIVVWLISLIRTISIPVAAVVGRVIAAIAIAAVATVACVAAIAAVSIGVSYSTVIATSSVCRSTCIPHAAVERTSILKIAALVDTGNIEVRMAGLGVGVGVEVPHDGDN